MPARKLDLGQGLVWYGCGWNLFRQNIALWILFAILFLVMSFVVSFIPVLGPLMFMLVTPMLMAGFFMGADDLRAGRSLKLETLFGAFTDDEVRTPLLVLGALLLGLLLASFVVMILVMGPGIMNMSAGVGEGIVLQRAMTEIAGPGFAVSLLLCVLIAMCMFFAVPLVTFDHSSAVAAVKISFQAAMTNILPFLLFLIVYVVLAFIAMIPFYLGLIVLIPVVFCAIYCAYWGIFK